MAGRYAKSTRVSVAKSKEEIERTLVRYGADQFLYGADHEENFAIVGFRYEQRQIKMRLPMPERGEFFGLHHDSIGREYYRSEDAAEKLYEKAQRQRWRALTLVIKAKLEAIESGIATFEDEFLAYTVLPGGQTVGEWAAPQLDKAMSNGKVPKLLPAGGRR